MTKVIPHILLMITAILAAATAAIAAGPDKVDFDREVRPILSEKCFHCHGPDAQAREADLRLDTREGIFRSVVVAGKLHDSELYRRIIADDADERMPPEKTGLVLTDAEKDTLRRWIEAGAGWVGHWSFEQPQTPALPKIKQKDWPQNEIDYFVLSRLEREGLAPSPQAERYCLIRRVTLDLTGLPPTPKEVDVFVNDRAAGAYVRVVDRLLNSPRYGERMAWPWLAASRYADTDGFQGDPTRTMWPWRQWLINALNANMPFDRFTVEMLAGDLLAIPTLEQVVATGFNRNHMYNGEGGRIAEETRVENVFDRTETISTVWLGLTMTCARCHDHKYDPIRQKEYYQLYSFFNNTSESGGRGGGKAPPTVSYLLPDQRQKLERLNVHIASINKRMDAAMPDVDRAQAVWELEAAKQLADAKPLGNTLPVDNRKTAKTVSDLPSEVAKTFAIAASNRSVAQKKLLRQYYREKHSRGYKGLKAKLAPLLKQQQAISKAAATVMVMDDLPDGKRRKTSILFRGIYNKPQPGEVLSDTPAFLPPLPQGAARNRLTMARWLVEPSNPLTARVTVNRYWQAFFGTGLVKTSEDFGRQGSRPTHPRLLDWLATKFIGSGWDVKAMQKMIVMSATYRQSSRVSTTLFQRDPMNQLMARASRYRMPSWMLRDQALAVSGLLVNRIGGPSVKPYQPAGVWAEATFGKIRYQPDRGEALYRRSLYIFWRRIIGPTMLFDGGKRQTCEVMPARTNTPLHALTTLNDTTFVEASRAMAERVMQSAKSADERIVLAFQLATARKPQAHELELLTRRLALLQIEFAKDAAEAEKLLAVGNSPRAPELDSAEHAAYTTICLLLLNLDEAISKE